MEAIVVFGFLGSLAAAGGWLVARRVRQRRVAVAPGPAPRPVAESARARAGEVPVCPTCRREYPFGTRFCPQDARALVHADDLDGVEGGSVSCRVCHRSFDAATRFCPFDAEELGSPGRGSIPPPDHCRDEMMGLGDKICPSCTGRYGGDETFCGRDGTALVTVN